MKTVFLLLLVGLLAPVLATAQPRKYYVSAGTGSDQNPGTLARPFASIQKAADAVSPGDTVFVRAGTYTNPCPGCGIANVTRAGTPSQWIVFQPYRGEQPLLKFDGWGGLSMQPGSAYVEVRGLRIQGASAGQSLAAALVQNHTCDGNGGIRPGPFEARYNGTGLSADGRYADAAYGRPHHLRFVNNEIFECGGGGISAIQSDYVTIENNLVYNNCWYTLFGSSGISLYQSWNYDRAPGYHMVVRGNRCFGNRLFVPWYEQCAISDGNGIIIDDGKHTQNGSTLGPYQSRTLVANNLLVGNGGSGIHAYESERVDIVNNTAYHNSQSVELDGGEIFANVSNDVRIQNNILVPLPGNVVNINFQNNSLVTTHNLHFGGTTEAVPGTATVRADPRFVRPTLDWRTADFGLQAGSPALDAGLAAGAPATDFDGRSRPQGTGIDLGAFERTVAGPLPVVLVSFTAVRAAAGAALAWATASETRNAGFGVERSADGRTFRRIGWVVGRGTTARPTTYSFVDSALGAPAPRPVYYRLRQTDTDGGGSYSPVRTLAADPAAGPARALALAPNPAGAGEVWVSGARPGTLVRAFSVTGREVLRAPADAAGLARLRGVSALPSGLYVVRNEGRSARLVRP